MNRAPEKGSGSASRPTRAKPLSSTASSSVRKAGGTEGSRPASRPVAVPSAPTSTKRPTVTTRPSTTAKPKPTANTKPATRPKTTSGEPLAFGSKPSARAFVQERLAAAQKSGSATHDDSDLPLPMVKAARQSGQLNLSNRGLQEVPDRVWRLNDPDEEEKSKIKTGLSIDRVSCDFAENKYFFLCKKKKKKNLFFSE